MTTTRDDARARILLVEDDPDDVAIFTGLLGKLAADQDYLYDHADSVDKACVMVARHRYDLCFFDHQLGAETGLDLLRRLRGNGFSKPVIMLTGQGDEQLAVEAMKAGASDYLIKAGLGAAHLEAAIQRARRLNLESERRREIEIALRVSEARYRDLVGRLPVILCELDAEGRTLFVNRAVHRMTGYAPEELIGRDWWDMLGHDPDGSQIPRVRAALRAGDIAEFELTLSGKSGHLVTVEWHSSNRYRQDSTLDNVLCIGMDVSERVRLREELRQLAVRDELTGLNNRRGFMTLADQRLKLALREKASMLLVFIDVDGLKTINDQFGHAEGDRALQDMASVIRKSYRESDIFGRLGGDEFVVLVEEGSPFRDDGVIQRLRDTMCGFAQAASRPYMLEASMGVARFDPDKPSDIGQLLNRADTVMYEHKQQRRQRVVSRP